MYEQAFCHQESARSYLFRKITSKNALNAICHQIAIFNSQDHFTGCKRSSLHSALQPFDDPGSDGNYTLKSTVSFIRL